MTQISAHIVTYNHGSGIIPCLEALLVQREAFPDLQICVVDNASQDDTIIQIRQFTAARQVEILIIASPINTGYAGGHNLALKATVSDFVLTLNPDVRLRPVPVPPPPSPSEQDPSRGRANRECPRYRPCLRIKWCAAVQLL